MTLAAPVAPLSILTNTVGAGFAKLFAAGLVGAAIYIAIIIYAKSKKVSKPVLELIDVGAKLVGAFSFLGILAYVTTSTPKAVILNQSQNLPDSDYSLWPPLLAIIVIAAITAFLTFRKKTTYSKSENQHGAGKTVSNPTFKTASRNGNPEWNLGLLRKIEWRRFEYVCEAIFKELGLRTEALPFGKDGGIDIKIYHQGSSNPDAVVQCKAWNTANVGVKEVRELLGVMANAKLSHGIFMTTSDFHKDAIAFASKNNIDLRNGQSIIDLINKLDEGTRKRIYDVATEGDYTTPTCASCGIKMIARDKFWGCANYPRCKTKIYFKAA